MFCSLLSVGLYSQGVELSEPDAQKFELDPSFKGFPIRQGSNGGAYGWGPQLGFDFPGVMDQDFVGDSTKESARKHFRMSAQAPSIPEGAPRIFVNGREYVLKEKADDKTVLKASKESDEKDAASYEMFRYKPDKKSMQGLEIPKVDFNFPKPPDLGVPISPPTSLGQKISERNEQIRLERELSKKEKGKSDPEDEFDEKAFAVELNKNHTSMEGLAWEGHRNPSLPQLKPGEAIAPAASVAIVKPKDGRPLSVEELAKRYRLSDLCRERLVRFFAKDKLFESAEPGYAPELKGLDSFLSYYQKYLLGLYARMEGGKLKLAELRRQLNEAGALRLFKKDKLKTEIEHLLGLINADVQTYNSAIETLNTPDAWHDSVALAIHLACRRMSYDPTDSDELVDEGGVMNEIRNLAVFIEPNVDDMRVTPAEKATNSVFDSAMRQVWSIHRQFAKIDSTQESVFRAYQQYLDKGEAIKAQRASVIALREKAATNDSLAKAHSRSNPFARRDPAQIEYERLAKDFEAKARAAEKGLGQLEKEFKELETNYNKIYYQVKGLCEDVVKLFNSFVVGDKNNGRYKEGAASWNALNDFYLSPLQANANNLLHQLKVWGTAERGSSLRINVSKLALANDSCQPNAIAAREEIRRLISEFRLIQSTYKNLNDQALLIVEDVEKRARQLFFEETLDGRGLPAPLSPVK